METTALVTKKTPFIINAILGAAILTVLLWFYWPVLLKWAAVIYEDENYSFGLLILPVIGFIIYRKWPELTRLPQESSWLGLPFLLLAFGIYLYGTIVDLKFIQLVSFWLMVIGLMLLQGGWVLLRLLSFPLFLMLITIPLPKMIINAFTFRLQLFSSSLSAAVMRFLGFTVHLQGNVIDLGGRQLQVAEACSGLGYVVNALVLGIVFCYFFQRRPLKVLLLLLSLLPAAIAANVLRLVSIAYFPFMQEGFWHMSLGLSIFILGFDYLRLINWLLNRYLPGSEKTPRPPAEAREEVASASPAISYYLFNGLALFFLLLAYPLSQSFTQPPPVPLKQGFNNFPMEIDGWKGTRNFIDKEIAAVLDADDYLEVNYQHPEKGSITLWIAYYASQNIQQKKHIHLPDICLSGSGWRIKASNTIELASGIPARLTVAEMAGRHHAFLYSFFYGGHWLANEERLMQLYMGMEGLLYKRTNGAIVRVSTPIDNNLNWKMNLEDFMSKIILITQNYFPKNKL